MKKILTKKTSKAIEPLKPPEVPKYNISEADKREKNRINKILQHPQYKEYVAKIEEYEKERIFCKHDMTHFLDVCRLAEILWLTDENYNMTQILHIINEELIYAAGLLHDIGRWQEYETGIGHEIASAKLAYKILAECDFRNFEIDEIISAIKNHRNKEVREEYSLSGILYRADKMSRSCFACKAEAECDWDAAKKNMQIIY